MSTRLPYRPEIDGLRTVAVVSVLLFHAELTVSGRPLLAGGYIGVDVFFVISGYLITAIILRDLDAGSFRFAEFYERRARRILPILFTVILASLPFAWFLLLPRALSEFGTSAIAAGAFVSNVWFWSEDPYWATDSSLKPLLHTWSLAVEEQFYLVTPFLLVLLHRWRLLPALVALAALAGLSLALAEATSRTHPSFAFYMLPARFWELLAGTCLAFAETRRGAATRGPLRAPLALAGLAMILGPVVLFDETTRHPSLLTTIPVAGTCLVVWCARGGDPVSAALRWPPIVSVGLISYSLYMWHYPVLVFGRLLHGDDPGNLYRAGLIAVSVALAVLSYHAVERPFRNRARLPWRRAAAGLGALALPGLVFAVAATASDGFKQRFHELRDLYGAAEFDNALLRARKNRSDLSATPQWGEAGQIDVLVTGDSHAQDLFNMLALNAALHPGVAFNVRAISVTDVGPCFLHEPERASQWSKDPDFVRSDLIVISERFRRRKSDLACLDAYLAFLARQEKPAILTSLSNIYRRKRVSAEGLGHFSRLHAANNAPVLADNYLLRSDKSDALLARYEADHFALRKADEIARTNAALREIAARHGVIFLSKQAYQCDADAGRCDLLTPEGRKIYHDRSHYTLQGARYLGQKAHGMGWFRRALEQLDLDGS